MILPLITLKNDSLPINGSATVLKQTAASGPFESETSSTGSSSDIAYSDFGAGHTSAMKSTSRSHASPVRPLNAKTGIMEPSAIPMRRPLILSFLVSSSPPKYFSISSSSVPATASLKTSLIASKRAVSSGSTSVKATFVPLYEYVVSSIIL